MSDFNPAPIPTHVQRAIARGRRAAKRKAHSAAPPLLGCCDKQLAERLGSVCVSGDVLTGDALVKYLNHMPSDDKESMLEDLALLKAWAIMEKNVPDDPERGTAQPNEKLTDHRRE